MPQLTSLITLCLFLLGASANANDVSINSLLARHEVPEGVVIEIVTSDNKGLEWALPRAEDYIKQLRQRFPDLAIAIVTHGREQFALQKSKQNKHKALHKKTRSLLQNDVQLHVCGTFAGWRGLSEEDFPDYVNVAAAGPSQINDYRALGYEVIVIK